MAKYVLSKKGSFEANLISQFTNSSHCAWESQEIKTFKKNQKVTKCPTTHPKAVIFVHQVVQFVSVADATSSKSCVLARKSERKCQAA